MRARVLHTPDLPVVDAFLRKHADGSMLLRGNIALDGIEDDGGRYSGVWAGAFDEQGELQAVAGHFRNSGNVIPQAESLPALDAALACAVGTSGAPVRGAIGPRALVRHALVQLGLRDVPARYDCDEGLYALDLDQLREPPLLSDPSVEFRAARASDREFLVRWSIAYETESLGGTETPELRARCEEGFERGLAGAERCLVAHRGVPCAQTDFNSRLPDMVQIGGVYTPPEARSRGYARTAVAASLVEARERGVRRAILFTGDDNPAAIKAYRALGFERVGDFAIVLR